MSQPIEMMMTDIVAVSIAALANRIHRDDIALCNLGSSSLSANSASVVSRRALRYRLLRVTTAGNGFMGVTGFYVMAG